MYPIVESPVITGTDRFSDADDSVGDGRSGVDDVVVVGLCSNKREAKATK